MGSGLGGKRRGAEGATPALPNTTTKGAGRRWPLYALAAAALVALVLYVMAFLRVDTFSPGKEIDAPSVKDIAVSTKDGLYPPPDTSRFAERPESIFVYLSVEGLPEGDDLEARVESVGSGSAFSFLGQEAGLEAEQGDNASMGVNGTSGVVKFTLKTSSGEPVPPGNYTVDVYDSGAGTVAARKSFVVEG